MKEILIDRAIGGFGGVSASEIRNEFQQARDGEEIKLVIDSPGGDCFEGISIYNFIRDFARNNPNRINVYIQGMAASAASWVACAANSVNPENKITVEDNSIFMIHNCWGIAVGDHREMEKSADFSKRIDKIIISMLSSRSKKNEKEITKLMNDETWYFGKEILESGFCDEIIGSDPEDYFEGGRGEYLDIAKEKFFACKKQLKEDAEKNSKEYKDSFERSYSAFNLICEKSDFSDENKISEKSEEERRMTLDELKAKEPNLLNEVISESAENAIAKERNRVANLLEKFEKAGNSNAALVFIRNGKTVADDEVLNALIETANSTKKMNDRVEDEPPAFNPPASTREVEDEATKAFKAAFGL